MKTDNVFFFFFLGSSWSEHSVMNRTLDWWIRLKFLGQADVGQASSSSEYDWWMAPTEEELRTFRLCSFKSSCPWPENQQGHVSLDTSHACSYLSIWTEPCGFWTDCEDDEGQFRQPVIFYHILEVKDSQSLWDFKASIIYFILNNEKWNSVTPCCLRVSRKWSEWKHRTQIVLF